MAMSVVALSLCQIIGTHKIIGKIRWEGTSGDVFSSLLPRAGSVRRSNQVAQGFLQPGLKYFRRWGWCHPPEQCFLAVTTSLAVPVIHGNNISLCCVFDIYSLCSLFFTALSLSKRRISLPLQFPPFLAGLLHLTSLLMNILAHHATALQPFIC